MDFIKKINENNIFQFVKDNATVLIFFITATWAIISFFLKTLMNYFYTIKFQTLRIPDGFIDSYLNNTVNYSSIIMFSLLFIISTIIVIFGVHFFFFIKNKGKYSKVLSVVLLMIIFGLSSYCLNFVLFYNIFKDVKIWQIFVLSALTFLFQVFISIFTYNHFKTIKGFISYFFSIIAYFIIIFTIISSLLNLKYINSTKYQQVYTQNSKQYVSLCSDGNRFVIARCKESGNELVVYTDEQMIIEGTNQEYSMKKYDSIIIE